MTYNVFEYVQSKNLTGGKLNIGQEKAQANIVRYYLYKIGVVVFNNLGFPAISKRMQPAE